MVFRLSIFMRIVTVQGEKMLVDFGSGCYKTVRIVEMLDTFSDDDTKDLSVDELDWIALAPKTLDRQDNPPGFVDKNDEDTWERAKEIAKKNWDRWDNPWAVTVHIFKRMIGE